MVKNHYLAGFRVATFSVFPPNGDFFVFSHGDLAPRHKKVRDFPCVAFSATFCRIFAWLGERSPCENPPKSPFSGFSRGDLSSGENAKRRHAITRKMVKNQYLAGFRLATFRPATRKYATFHALRFRLLFVVSLPGGAKGRHAKTRQNHHNGGFSHSDLSRFRPENTLIRHGTNQPP